MKVVRLGDILDFRNGRSFMKSEWKVKGLPIIRIQNLNNRDAPFNYFDGEYDKNIEIRQGDLLFSWSGTVGTSFGPHIWNGEMGVLNQHIFKLSKKVKIEDRYVYYALKEITSEIEEQTHGAGGLVHITKEKLNRFTILMPDIEEQWRVVERLDAAFEKIDRAIELTEKNIQNAWHLFDSLRVVQFGNGDITKKLGEVLVLQRGYDLPKKQRTQGIHPLVSSSGIIDHIHEYKVKGPGICTGRSGSVGATFYVENDFWPLNTTLYIKDYLGNDTRYCYWLLYGLDLKQFAGGTGVPTLNRNIVHEHTVKISSDIKIQKEIASMLDAEYLRCRNLYEKYQEKLKYLKALKQSLLTQAFSQSEVE